MSDHDATVIGAPAYRASNVPPLSRSKWTLSSLAHRDETAREAAAEEAAELARALAAQAVALAPDADTGEYQERRRTLAKTLWSDAPLSGYTLQSSLGAYVIARVASSWAPPTSSALRSEPLDRDGILAAFRDRDLDPKLAGTIVGDWQAPAEEFRPDETGLDSARLAALAEGTLTDRERDLALSQAAYSPRCLARLASTALAISRARIVLPVLPPEDLDLGGGYAPAAAALALGRPDRTLDLLGYSPDHLALRTLVELAKAQWSLGRGDPAALPGDPSLVLPPIEEDLPSNPPRTMPPPPPSASDASDDEDDVLEIVEEKVATGQLAPMDPTRDDRRAPRTPAWSAVDLGRTFDEAFLTQWQSARRAKTALLARSGRLLGLVPQPPPRSIPRQILPPEPRVLVSLIERSGLAADEESSNLTTARISIDSAFGGVAALASPEPIFAVARSVVRAIALAAEGRAPSVDAIEGGGDVDWLLRRARALALAARGELDRALGTLSGADIANCPEARWIQLRAMRFSGRKAERAPASEVRPVAALLVADLTQALLRSIAGTVA